MKKGLFILILFFCYSQAFTQENLIQFDYSQYNVGSDQNRTVLVWNTKTGKSARYYYSSNSWKKSATALPENPLGDKSSEIGEIMMDYSQYNVGANQNRTILVWNTKTGKSTRYYYSNNSWKKSPAALPENPLGDKSSKIGEIMMDYSQYNVGSNQNRTILVWNTKTGKSARYYYSNDSWKKSAAALPKNPLN